MLGQRADMIGHQVGPGGAVHPHRQQVVIGDGRVKRVDGLAAQHGAGAFDGGGRDDRDIHAEIVPQLFDGQQRGLEAAGIENSFHQQEIRPAFHQRPGLLVVATIAGRER